MKEVFKHAHGYMEDEDQFIKFLLSMLKTYGKKDSIKVQQPQEDASFNEKIDNMREDFELFVQRLKLNMASKRKKPFSPCKILRIQPLKFKN